jgi:hypothetical protein
MMTNDRRNVALHCMLMVAGLIAAATVAVVVSSRAARAANDGPGATINVADDVTAPSPPSENNAQPSTQPAAANDHNGTGTVGGAGSGALAAPGDARRLGPGNPGPRGVDELQPPPTPDEIVAAEVWASRTFPVRFHAYELLRSDRPAKRVMALNFVKHYRMFRRLQEQQPELYDFMLKQEQLRDKAFEYAAKAARGDAEAQSKLRDLVSQIYDMNLQERAARIERMQKNLTDMQDQLTRDRDRRDQRIDEQTKRMMEESSRGPGNRDRGGATTKKSD